MKAIAQERYGGPDALRLTEMPVPVPGDNEVLVRVHAASLNARDWHALRGDPYIARLMAPRTFGPRRPGRRVPGSDFAGRVEAVGKAVTRFSPGDEVYGDSWPGDGAFAEYARVPESTVERKPANTTYEQAAALPLAGITALVGLRDVGQVAPGRRVLVNGASGGVGTFAVQIAKALGAEVTAVCSTRNVDLVSSLGADSVLDYTKQDFARRPQRYDVVFDLVANRRLRDLRRVLTPTGTLLLSGGGTARAGRPYVLGPVRLTLKAAAVGPFTRQRLHTLMDTGPTAERLAALRELVESGQVTPVIDGTYKLAEVPEAMRYLMVEHARAKVVITM